MTAVCGVAVAVSLLKDVSGLTNINLLWGWKMYAFSTLVEKAYAFDTKNVSQD